MQFTLPASDLIRKYVAFLARLSALDYSRARDEQELFLPYAVNEDDASQIETRRDRYFAQWVCQKQQIAEILAPYRCS
jgi:hypothetical protein